MMGFVGTGARVTSVRRNQAGELHVVVHDRLQRPDLIRTGAGNRADALNGHIANAVVGDGQAIAGPGCAAFDREAEAEGLLTAGDQRIAGASRGSDRRRRGQGL